MFGKSTMTSIQIKNLTAKPNKNDTKDLLHTENIREVKDCTVLLLDIRYS